MTPLELKKYYDSREFKEKYLYEGADLGAVCGDSETVFKLWSPLSERIWLNLYETGESQVCKRISMQRLEKGVWEYHFPENLHGTYYDYQIEREGETLFTADPYARACNCNGARSMVVDLKRTDPEGWEKDEAPVLGTEQIIYELHVKDFSYDQASGVPEQYRGKYKAFTLEGTTLNQDGIHPTCLDYLVDLGVTHVQLMPVYDYASVNEAGDSYQYNWGYDPCNYNIPEGSYSTDPFHGEVRIRELKELILALHSKGIRVNMDVVYNHTFHTDSWLSRAVPYYYYRLNEDGSYSNGSACGNDLASEREMCGKYILDSVLYWCREYHLDGFRFDLMGLLDVDLMNRIRQELDIRYGKGEKMIYGEPWSDGVSPMEEGYLPCYKENVKYLEEGIAVFCDNTRDSIKGHVFFEKEPGFVNGGEGLEKEIFQSVKAWCGGKDSFAKAPSQIISYVSAHDNLTLWDKLVVTLKKKSGEQLLDEQEIKAFYRMRDEEIIRAYKMAAAMNFTCQGNLFFLAGEEYGRTKQGDSNSFISSPELNQIDWNRAYEYADVLEYYRGLINLRKQLPGLCDKSQNAGIRITDETILEKGVIHFSVWNGKESEWEKLFVIYNSRKQAVQVKLPHGEWELLLDGESSVYWAKTDSEKLCGEVSAAPVSVVVLGQSRK